MTVPDLVLNSGRTIPQLGFGVAQIGAAGTADAVAEALRVGYRHIDTAQRYGNEKEVAEAIRDSGLNRDEVYLTSKLSRSIRTSATKRCAPPTPSTGSSPRPGRRSLWVGFLRIRELERSLAGSAGLRLRSCFAGTFNVAT